MPPKTKEIAIRFHSEEHFLQYYNENNKKLLVVDIFSQWSGPCELMNPTYKYLAQNFDDFEKRIELGQMEFEKLKLLKDDKKF